MSEEEVQEVEESIEEPQEEVVETETVEELTEPTAEVEETTEEAPKVEEPKTVPLDALQDERKKRQDLERKIEGLEAGVNSLKGERPPKDIYEAYDRDSKGVVADVNKEIKRLVTDDAYGNASEIEGLRDLKDEFRKREFNNIQSQLNRQTGASRVLSAITAQVPDFSRKMDKLSKFAIEELGYTQEDLMQRTDPSLGDTAVREVVRINKLYDRLTAKPQGKVVKPKATTVEGAGKGVTKSGPNMASLLESAQKSGDWTEYFDAKGLLEE